METKRKKTKVVIGVLTLAGLAVFSLFAVGGSLQPSAPPAPTMKTLDQIPPSWSQTLDVSERFVPVLSNAAVLDRETGLVWAKNANIANGTKDWEAAVSYCRTLTVGNRMGWRLPTIEELTSLTALPGGHPFLNVQPGYYWSSTTIVSNAGYAWNVYLTTGGMSVASKSFTYYVLPVRGCSGPAIVTHTPSP